MFPPLVVAILALAQAPAELEPVDPILSLPAHQPQAMTVAFSPDGKWMASSGANKFVTLREPTTGEIRLVLSGHPGLMHEVAFSPDSSLLASAGAEGIVILWSVESGEKLFVMQALAEDEGTARTVAFSPNGELLAVDDLQGGVSVWELERGKRIHRYAGHDAAVLGIAVHPEAKISATASLNGTLKMWSVDFAASR